jgi:SPW repeat-containing protein
MRVRVLQAPNGSTEETAETSWAITVLGFWTLAAPFALHYKDKAHAMWNDAIVGIVLAVVATSMQPLQHQQHGAH